MDPMLPTASQSSDVLLNPPADLSTDPLLEPVSSQTGSNSASEVVSDPSDDFVDLTFNLTDSPGESAAAESTDANATKDTAEIPLDEPSEELVDIFGGESEAVAGDVVAALVTGEAAMDESGGGKSPVDGKTANEVAHEVKEPIIASVLDIGSDDMPVSNTQQPQASDKLGDPLVDLLSEAPPTADAQKPSRATVDLFEDEGSDLFVDSWQKKSVKQPQKSLFEEADDDLFAEPLGATSKKTIGKEQQYNPVVTTASGDASNIGGPLQDSDPAEPTDLFTEEALTTVPSIRNTSAVNSKANGVHSEEDTDIFAGKSSIILISYILIGGLQDLVFEREHLLIVAAHSDSHAFPLISVLIKM